MVARNAAGNSAPQRLPPLGNFPRSRITIESVRLEGRYPESRVVVSVREYETAHDDVYKLWDDDFRFSSPEEAADLIAAWVGENN